MSNNRITARQVGHICMMPRTSPDTKGKLKRRLYHRKKLHPAHLSVNQIPSNNNFLTVDQTGFMKAVVETSVIQICLQGESVTVRILSIAKEENPTFLIFNVYICVSMFFLAAVMTQIPHRLMTFILWPFSKCHLPTFKHHCINCPIPLMMRINIQ